MIIVTHYDDKKEKSDSHEVTITEPDFLDELGLDFSSVYGYGETKEEAMEEFKMLFNAKFENLKKFQEKLNSGEIEIVEVNGLGKPIQPITD